MNLLSKFSQNSEPSVPPPRVNTISMGCVMVKGLNTTVPRVASSAAAIVAI